MVLMSVCRWRRSTKNRFYKRRNVKRRRRWKLSWIITRRKQVVTASRQTVFIRLPTSFVAWTRQSTRATTSGSTRVAAGCMLISTSRSTGSRGASKTRPRPVSRSTFAACWIGLHIVTIVTWRPTVRCACSINVVWTPKLSMPPVHNRCKTFSTASEAGLLSVCIIHVEQWTLVIRHHISDDNILNIGLVGLDRLNWTEDHRPKNKKARHLAKWARRGPTWKTVKWHQRSWPLRVIKDFEGLTVLVKKRPENDRS